MSGVPPREPAPQLLPVSLQPLRVDLDLLQALRALRGRLALEERLALPRPFRRRERLGDLSDAADEETGGRIPPIELGPVVLDELPGQVPADSRPVRRPAPDDAD